MALQAADTYILVPPVDVCHASCGIIIPAAPELLCERTRVGLADIVSEFVLLSELLAIAWASRPRSTRSCARLLELSWSSEIRLASRLTPTELILLLLPLAAAPLAARSRFFLDAEGRLDARMPAARYAMLPPQPRFIWPHRVPVAILRPSSQRW